MQGIEKPTVERSRRPQLICSAGSELNVAAPRRGFVARLACRLAVVIDAWRERQRARRRRESWLTMDHRLLADIGLRRDDVQAMVYGGVLTVRLAERGGRWPSSAVGEKMASARPWTPQLRVVAGDDLDAAA